MSDPATRSPCWDMAAVAARWVLGVLFVYMGMSKALDPVGFLKLVRQYDLPVGSLLMNMIAAGLPWFEVFCGVLLLLGVAVRGTALLMIAMLVPFTAMVIRRGLEIATARELAICSVRFDCGCGAGEVYLCAKILENCVLVAVSVWLLTGTGRRLSLRYAL